MEPKEEYISQQHRSQMQAWFKKGLLASMPIYFIFGVFLDWFTAREYFSQFMLIRLFGVASLALVYHLCTLTLDIKRLQILFLLVTSAIAITLQYMIMHIGGYLSEYYIGHILVIIIALGFMPITMDIALLIVSSIYVIYLAPILWVGGITNLPTFFIHNIFLLCTFVATLVARRQSTISLLHELGLQYELELKKHDLEELVQQRTRELDKSERWHRELFQNATDGVMILDKLGVIINANRKTCDIHGFSMADLIGTHINMLSTDEALAIFAHSYGINPERPDIFETTHYQKNGNQISLEISAQSIVIENDTFTQIFLRDITERKKLQEQLFESRKMESIGNLVGGITHDFRNIITSMLGFIELVRVGKMPHEKLVKSSFVIERSVRNANNVISQLLGFARKSEKATVPIDLNNVVKDCVRLFQMALTTLDKNITLDVRLDESLLYIEGDIGEFENIIMNLFTNAKDAMPEGGSIAAETIAANIDESHYHAGLYIRPGKYSVLQITDTGNGIPADIMNNIFEPFFTTKKRGKGTGLGLAMAQGVISKHQGIITVESRVGTGTTFTIFLPVTDKVIEVANTSAEYLVANDNNLRGTETILVVDDEESVLSFVVDTLELNGYKPIPVSSSQDAIALFKNQFQYIDLLITDVVMPLVDGTELTKQLLKIKPSLNIIKMSAYSKSNNIYRAELQLHKPFSSNELLKQIRNCLDCKDVIVNI